MDHVIATTLLYQGLQGSAKVGNSNGISRTRRKTAHTIRAEAHCVAGRTDTSIYCALQKTRASRCDGLLFRNWYDRGWVMLPLWCLNFKFHRIYGHCVHERPKRGYSMYRKRHGVCGGSKIQGGSVSKSTGADSCRRVRRAVRHASKRHRNSKKAF